MPPPTSGLELGSGAQGIGKECPLSAMVAWSAGRNWVRADRFGGRRKAFSRCLEPAKVSCAYILAHLHRDRPDLAVRVDAGEISANAAAISGEARDLLGNGVGTTAAEILV